MPEDFEYFYRAFPHCISSGFFNDANAIDMRGFHPMEFSDRIL